MVATVLILNGVGSAGKSSIARALQGMTREPFLHVEMDAFLEMLPPAYQDHPDAFSYETVLADGLPSVVIRTGPVGERLMRGFRRSVAALAAQGNNLIVDEVMLEDEAADYAGLLAGFAVRLVGIHAPLNVLEARERERGDRMAGLARWQYGRVHRNISYDLEIDTTDMDPLACATMIRDAFGL